MILVSIIIPTLNGSSTINKLLQMIKNQKTSFEIEVIIIDSGSTDGTLEQILSFSKNLKIISIKIPKKEFNHGLTRNLAIKQSHGKFIILLTQDAIPLNEYWLDNLVNPLLEDQKIAGVFGRHIPYPDCNPFEKRDLLNLFHGFGNKVVSHFIYDKDNPEKVFENNKHQLAFFSSNNACIRRSVWNYIPYRKTSILGEDQMWAKDILLAGYKKAYSPHAIVYHSHNYSPMAAFRRWIDDYRFYTEFHGNLTANTFLKTLFIGFKLALDNCNYLKNNADTKHSKRWKNYGIAIAFSRIFAEYFAINWHRIPSFLRRYFSQNEMHERLMK